MQRANSGKLLKRVALIILVLGISAACLIGFSDQMGDKNVASFFASGMCQIIGLVIGVTTVVLFCFLYGMGELVETVADIHIEVMDTRSKTEDIYITI